MSKNQSEAEETFEFQIVFIPNATYYEAVLPNGARFAIEARDIHGKLRDNLDLFREATVLAETPNRPSPLPKRDYVGEHLANGGIVQKCGKQPKIRLEDLELDL